MYGDDIDGVVWYTDNVKPVTKAELDAEVERLAAVESDKIEADAAATVGAIAHAKSLGFTDAMIAVMYPNLGAQND